MSKSHKTSSTPSPASTPRESTDQSSVHSSPKHHQGKKEESKEQSLSDDEQEESVESDEGGPTPSTLDNDLLPDIKKNPPEEIALTAANLGILFGFAMATLFFSTYKEPSIYLMSLSVFHFLEFYITAKYNPKKVHKESFIINNGSSYTVAHTIAIIEAAVEYVFFPNFKKSFSWIKIIGLILLVGGQIIRSWAMITAGKSFSHLIVIKKSNEHELVTHGIYSVFRHPSYTGFFWWAVGTQLVLVNPIALVGFIIILWMFFSKRIEFEEKYLISFFGERYENYRKTAFVYIPFIN